MRAPDLFRPALLLAGLLCAPWIATPAAADDAARARALEDEAKAMRKAADTRFAAEEHQCYQRFMVNRCIREAKDARLAEIRRAREIEAEARRLELAERRRLAERIGAQPDAAILSPAAPSTDPQPTQADPALEAERAAREQAAARKQAEAAARRAGQDAERAARRSAAEAAAAERAAAAQRDRDRYEERIRARQTPPQ